MSVERIATQRCSIGAMLVVPRKKKKRLPHIRPLLDERQKQSVGKTPRPGGKESGSIIIGQSISRGWSIAIHSRKGAGEMECISHRAQA